MDTTQLGVLVDPQRLVAGHVKHVPGVCVIQATGTLGQLWAVFGLGLKPSEGWAGYGTHIKKARFGQMGEIGPAVLAQATCTKQRQIRGTWFCDFSFRFSQDDRTLYTSEQTAAWVKEPGPQS